MPLFRRVLARRRRVDGLGRMRGGGLKSYSCVYMHLCCSYCRENTLPCACSSAWARGAKYAWRDSAWMAPEVGASLPVEIIA